MDTICASPHCHLKAQGSMQSSLPNQPATSVSPEPIVHARPSYPHQGSNIWYIWYILGLAWLALITAPTFTSRWHRHKASWDTPGPYNFGFRCPARALLVQSTPEPPCWHLLQIKPLFQVVPYMEHPRNPIPCIGFRHSNRELSAWNTPEHFCLSSLRCSHLGRAQSALITLRYPGLHPI